MKKNLSILYLIMALKRKLKNMTSDKLYKLVNIFYKYLNN